MLTIFIVLTSIALITLIGDFFWGGTDDSSSSGGHSGGHSGSHDEARVSASPGSDRSSTSTIYRWINGLRTTLYFLLGAGATGWIALAFSTSETIALVAAATVGVAFAVLVRIARRVQRSELDSSVSENELLYETGTLLVPIGPGQLGKVRFESKGSLIERYVKLEDPERSLEKDELVEVVEVRDDVLIVRRQREEE